MRSGREVERSPAAERVAREVPNESEEKEQDKGKEVTATPPFKPRIPYPAQLKNTQTD